MDMYSAPQIAHLMHAHTARSERRQRRRKLLRLAGLLMLALVIMAAICYVGPARAAYDPSPGAQLLADPRPPGSEPPAVEVVYKDEPAPAFPLLLVLALTWVFVGYVLAGLDQRAERR